MKKIINSASTGLLACALLAVSGCYSYTPIPLSVEGTSYSKVSKGEHKVIPSDCKILTLEKAQELAVKNNPNFISMKHALAAARARYYQSLSAYLPTVTASYNMGQDNFHPRSQKILSPGTGQDKSYRNYRTMGLQADWLVFDGLMRTMNMLAAKHSAMQSEALERDSRRLLLQAVATAYNNILLSVEQNRIAQADKDFQEKLLNETQIQYDAGAVPLSDVLNFSVKANQAESNRIDSEFSYKTAKYALAELMGLTKGDIPDSVKFPSLKPSKPKYLLGVDIYLDMALNNRPDLKAYREALEVAKFTVYARWGAFSPVVRATGLMNYQKQKTRFRHKEGGVADSRYTTGFSASNFNYGGTVEWELFSGGSTWANLREAQALLAQSKYDLVEQWINVIAEVRQSYENYKKTAEQVTLFKKIYELQKKARDLVQEEYKAGRVSITRLNEAQKDLVTAESNMVSSIINLSNAIAQLDASTGSKVKLESKEKQK